MANSRRFQVLVGLAIVAAAPALAAAQTPLPVPTLSLGLQDATEPKQIATSLQILALMTVLSLAPAILVLTTSFTRMAVHGAKPEVLLVAPVATEDEELRRLVEGFAPLGLDRVVLTKLDDIARPGRLVELAHSLSRPVAWVTFGRAARGAGSTPDDPRVIARILGTTLAVERTA